MAPAIEIRKTVSDFIIVFVSICVPICWTTFAAFRQSYDLMTISPLVVPVFFAGFALESHANRIIAQQGNVYHATDNRPARYAPRRNSSGGSGADEGGA